MILAPYIGHVRSCARPLACWVYADGPQPYSENDPLDLRADGPYAIVVEGVVALERLTTGSLRWKASSYATARYMAREPGSTR
jgi:hypothetical protein